MQSSDKQELIYQTLVSVYQLLKERLPPPSARRDDEVNRRGAEVNGRGDANGRSDANDLMTVREAYIELNVSRGTVDRLRQEGSLTSLYFNGGVRLLRSEVLAAKKWYSGMKGKV